MVSSTEKQKVGQSLCATKSEVIESFIFFFHNIQVNTYQPKKSRGKRTGRVGEAVATLVLGP